jgi:hypothetical protein
MSSFSLFQIIPGGKASLQVDLLNPDNNDRPYDLTGLTAASTCFDNADGTELVLTLVAGIVVVGNAILGQLAINLTAAQTALLAQVDNGTLELSLTFGSSDPVKCQIPNAFQVLSAAC